MIKVKIGDLFESQATTLVNTVNCVGVMGKGIAQEFKKRFPEMFSDYAQRCNLNRVVPGVPYLYTDLLGTSIINFPTKKHWRSPSRISDIIHGLDVFLNEYEKWNIDSVAFPPLGCGNGGLEWSLVGPIIYQKLSAENISVDLFAPYGTPKKQLSIDFLEQPVDRDDSVKGHTQRKFNVAWVALLNVIDELQKQPYANPVGRTIFQKICYVMTELGLETGFEFRQGSYGPFSPEVQDTLSVFANMNLVQEQQLGRMTALKIGPEYKTILTQYANQLSQYNDKVRKTVDLFSRVKSTKQAEEVTTVLYAARTLKTEENKNSVTEQDIFDFIIDWKKTWTGQEKRNSIVKAIRNLEVLGWLRLKYSESLPQPE